MTRPDWNKASKAKRTAEMEHVRGKVNNAIDYLSRVLINVDYHTAPATDLSWLDDPDDHPIMQTALAAKADTLVTDNATDFPPGERRNNVLLLDSNLFLNTLYEAVSESEERVREYLSR